MIRNLLVKMLSAYGRWAAHEASIHGSYEPRVPKALRRK